LDDSRVQAARLSVLNTITNEIAEATKFEPMVGVVLRELLRHTRARASWFRKLEEGTLVLTSQQGMSTALADQIRTIDLPASASQALRQGRVQIVRMPQVTPGVRGPMNAEGIGHLIVVPVQSKSSDIGILVLGMRGYRTYTDNDKDFLQAAAKQVGLAAENRGLVQQLVRSRNEWASTFNSIPDYILVHNHEYRILQANRALLDRLGLPGMRVVQKLCEAVLPGAGARWQSCPYCENVNSTAGEYDPCFGGYSVVSTSADTSEDATRGATIHVIKDTTEARAAEQRYKALFSHMQEGVFVATPEGRIIDCNEAFVRMLGYASREEVMRLGAAGSLYRSAEDQEKFTNEMLRQGFVRNFEYRLRRPDRQEISVSESSFATRDPGGKVERYQGVLLDLTEIKRAEEEVRRRNRELSVLNNIAVTFNQSFDLDEILQLTMQQIVELFSTDTSAIYMFDEATSALQKKSSHGHRSPWVLESENYVLPQEFVDTLKSTRAEIISHQDLPRLPQIIQQFVKSEGLRAWLWMVLWRKDKILGLLGTSSRMPRDFSPSDESVMIAVGRQLATTIEKIQLYNETRRAYEGLRHAQEQLLQSEKMSAVGQLISGVAHELNNPLTAIIGYTQLLESEKLDERVQEYVRKLQKQTQRTQKIVQNLLSFARQHKPQKLHVDLRRVVEDAIALRDYDLKVNNILVERDFDPALPSVMGDPHQLEQVCLNIINNAADALMEGPTDGQLMIRLFVEDSRVV
ncbi:MAG TPA: histidine kinase dimerization/phospho-acceptor domain-containing protein, partial [Candidatus Angelobacter sp.]|nr:histidine kinase dimerization/phospho-acceptor domain-containing protein [Candidatus Angelobacter sp.]